MPGQEGPDEVARLAEALRALASPTRLRVLAALRTPHKAADLTIPSEEHRGGLQPGRTLSRTTLIEHLEVLEGVGLVERLPADAGFVVSQQNVFAVVDALGSLTRIAPVVPVDVETTRPRAPAQPAPLPQGPRLVLSGGPREGQAFALTEEGPWTIGRTAEADVRLDYDPHVSRLQLRIHRDGGRFLAEALRGSTNPTRLNFVELAPGQHAPLVPGAVISVGASRLVFQP